MNVSSGQIHSGNMDEMIRKLYEKMQAEKEYDDPIEQKQREELEQLLSGQGKSGGMGMQCTAEKKDAEEKTAAACLYRLSEIDRLYAAAEIGEEAGFVRGFRYGFRLCVECLQS